MTWGLHSRLAAGLRVWARGHERHVWAAVELLIAHRVWLDRPDFRDRCIRRAASAEYGLDWWWIDWRAARTALDADQLEPASLAELAVLDLAIALGEDRYRLRAMSPLHRRLLADAVTRAVCGDGVTQ
jgi:hypothetical protein